MFGACSFLPANVIRSSASLRLCSMQPLVQCTKRPQCSEASGQQELQVPTGPGHKQLYLSLYTCTVHNHSHQSSVSSELLPITSRPFHCQLLGQHNINLSVLSVKCFNLVFAAPHKEEDVAGPAAPHAHLDHFLQPALLLPAPQVPCPLPPVHPFVRGSTSAPDRPTEGLWDRWLGPQAGIASKGDGTNR